MQTSRERIQSIFTNDFPSTDSPPPYHFDQVLFEMDTNMHRALILHAVSEDDGYAAAVKAAWYLRENSHDFLRFYLGLCCKDLCQSLSMPPGHIQRKLRQHRNQIQQLSMEGMQYDFSDSFFSRVERMYLEKGMGDICDFFEAVNKDLQAKLDLMANYEMSEFGANLSRQLNLLIQSVLVGNAGHKGHAIRVRNGTHNPRSPQTTTNCVVNNEASCLSNSPVVPLLSRDRSLDSEAALALELPHNRTTEAETKNHVRKVLFPSDRAQRLSCRQRTSETESADEHASAQEPKRKRNSVRIETFEESGGSCSNYSLTYFGSDGCSTNGIILRECSVRLQRLSQSSQASCSGVSNRLSSHPMSEGEYCDANNVSKTASVVEKLHLRKSVEKSQSMDRGGQLFNNMNECKANDAVNKHNSRFVKLKLKRLPAQRIDGDGYLCKNGKEYKSTVAISKDELRPVEIELNKSPEKSQSVEGNECLCNNANECEEAFAIHKRESRSVEFNKSPGQVLYRDRFGRFCKSIEKIKTNQSRSFGMKDKSKNSKTVDRARHTRPNSSNCSDGGRKITQAESAIIGISNDIPSFTLDDVDVVPSSDAEEDGSDCNSQPSVSRYALSLHIEDCSSTKQDSSKIKTIRGDITNQPNHSNSLNAFEPRKDFHAQKKYLTMGPKTRRRKHVVELRNIENWTVSKVNDVGQETVTQDFLMYANGPDSNVNNGSLVRPCSVVLNRLPSPVKS